MVTHAKEFRFLADIEMIPQILPIRSIVQTVHKILQQFTGSVGCDFTSNLNACFCQKLSAMIDCMEHEGEIVQTESCFVVMAVYQVVALALLHGQDHDIV